MRLIAALGVAAMLSTGMLVVPPAHASPDNCPPACDRIPDSAWIDPGAIPLNGTYSWPQLAGLAVTATDRRFRFEELCATPPLRDDPREYAVAARAAVVNSPGQWQLRVQVIHWRGEVWVGGQNADAAVASAAAALHACQVTAPHASPSLTTNQPGRLAAVISAPGLPPTVLHQYLVAHPASGTVVELAMWAQSPPAVAWPAIGDERVLDALITPLCTAYISSCD